MRACGGCARCELVPRDPWLDLCSESPGFPVSHVFCRPSFRKLNAQLVHRFTELRALPTSYQLVVPWSHVFVASLSLRLQREPSVASLLRARMCRDRLGRTKKNSAPSFAGRFACDHRLANSDPEDVSRQ